VVLTELNLIVATPTALNGTLVPPAPMVTVAVTPGA